MFLTRWLELGLFLVAALGVGAFVVDEVRSLSFQIVEGARLDRALARGREPGDAASPSVRAAPGTVLGRVEIPGAGLSAMVVEGCGDAELALAVGRIPGTARFGERGTVGLAGHRDGLFRPLERVRTGDRVVVTTPRGTYAYAVESIRVVEPETVGVLAPTGASGLVLVTCFPFSFVGPAPLRYVITARPAIDGAGVETTRPGTRGFSSGDSRPRSIRGA